jgi:hypothetical protein
VAECPAAFCDKAPPVHLELVEEVERFIVKRENGLKSDILSWYTLPEFKIRATDALYSLDS